MEYAGKSKKTSSERECLSWKKRYKTLDTRKQSRFHNSAFPDGSRKKAKGRCRNPDGDVGGPWCYVEPTEEEILEVEREGIEERKEGRGGTEQEDEGEEDNDIVKKDYCDVPFCDDEGKLYIYSYHVPCT